MGNLLCYTYYEKSSDFQDLLLAYEALFPEAMRYRWSRYLKHSDRIKSILSKLLTYEGIRQVHPYASPVTFPMQYDTLGRPFIRVGDFDFNLSHSGELIACVINYDGRVGIDVQSKKDRSSFLRFGRAIKGLTTRADTIDLDDWTALEAQVKCSGKGLRDMDAALSDKKEYVLKSIQIDQDYLCWIASKKQFSMIVKQFSEEELSQSIFDQIAICSNKLETV